MAAAPIAPKPQGVSLRTALRRGFRLRRAGFGFAWRAAGRRGRSSRSIFRLTIGTHPRSLRRTPAASPASARTRRAIGSRGRPDGRNCRRVSRSCRFGRPFGIVGRRAATLRGRWPIARGTFLGGDAGRCVTRVQARLLLLAGGNRRRFLSVREPTLAPATNRGKRNAVRPFEGAVSAGRVCRAALRSAGSTPSPAQPNNPRRGMRRPLLVAALLVGRSDPRTQPRQRGFQRRGGHRRTRRRHALRRRDHPNLPGLGLLNPF